MKEFNGLNKANELEGILRKTLNCGFGEFGVKANDTLLMFDWREGVIFALGYKLAESNNDQTLRDEIKNFLSESFKGNSIMDLIQQFEDYGFNSVEEAQDYVVNTISKIKELLT